MGESKPMATLMGTSTALDEDEEGEG